MQRRFAGGGALGNRRHAAEGDPGAGDPAIFQVEADGGADRGNIVVDALGDLVGLERLAGPGTRDQDLLDELAFFAGGDLVVEEVLLQR